MLNCTVIFFSFTLQVCDDRWYIFLETNSLKTTVVSDFKGESLIDFLSCSPKILTKALQRTLVILDTASESLLSYHIATFDSSRVLFMFRLCSFVSTFCK